MSFRDNLQHLRSTRNMTQEQLAMLLGVSRQSVTKWEAEKSYPEMDKLLKICDLFDVTLDDLVKGDLTGVEPVPAVQKMPDGPATDVIGYDEHAQRYARGLALGVGLIIAGVGLAQIASAVCLAAGLAGSVADTMQLVMIMAGVAVGLLFLLPATSDHARFKRDHPYVMDFYTDEEHRDHAHRQTMLTAVGIAIILTGVVVASLGDTGIGLSLVSGPEDYELSVSLGEGVFNGCFLLLVALGAGIIVWAQTRHGLSDVVAYNIDAAEELTEDSLEFGDYDEKTLEHVRAIKSRKRLSRMKGGIDGIIILVGSIVGLVMLFTGSEYFWVAWIVGGILCFVADLMVDLVWQARGKA
jgi:transcriptional regulator with XRE-family HTH domain